MTAGIAYRAESSSLVYQAPEIRDLMAAARVVADPSDQFSCVTALRSPLFGCGDDDLWTWKSGGGSFNILAPVPDERAEHPVGTGDVDYLRGLHYRSRWMTPSEVLGALIEDRRMLEVAADRPRARDQWRRLRFVVDQARAWSEVEHGGLRAYLAWAAQPGRRHLTGRRGGAARDRRGRGPDHDRARRQGTRVRHGGAVRHDVAAAHAQRGAADLAARRRYAVRLTQGRADQRLPGRPAGRRADGRQRAAAGCCTSRRPEPATTSWCPCTATRGEQDECQTSWPTPDPPTASDRFTAESVPGSRGTAARTRPAAGLGCLARPSHEARAATTRKPTVSASGLEGSEPEVVFGPQRGAVTDVRIAVARTRAVPRALGMSTCRPGRRAVTDRPSGGPSMACCRWSTSPPATDSNRQSKSQCFAEGVTDFTSVVADLTRSALDSAIVREAAVRSPLRESYVATQLEDGTVLEGIIDLMFRDDDGRS